jgi:transcriptional regulator with XRE-family HTH domain/tetratricopeptide (TPR) repeat protein
MNGTKKWNDILRHQRELKAWSQQKLAGEIGTNDKIVSRWERGISKPDAYYREKLCQLFGLNAVEFGFIEPLQAPEPPLPESTASASISPKEQAATEQDSLHFKWMIPLAPQPYFAHPYPLQENFTGRKRERHVLTEWFLGAKRPVFALIGMGGMGKSSLAWAWLQQDILSKSLPGLSFHPETTTEGSKASGDFHFEGVLWWSFYETEASFAAFLHQALAYASSGTVNPKNIESTYEKTQTLVTLLQHRRILLVLDGFERALMAYAGAVDAYREHRMPEDEHASFRVCIDHYAGSFLRWIAAGTLRSKVLLTSRLLPRELDGLAGCQREELKALDPEDAVTFFRAQGVRGTRVEIQAVCTLYGNHPLALRLLTGMIVNDPTLAGDIRGASEYNPIPEMVQREHHILTLAYNTLRSPLQQLLSRLAAFRSTVNLETIQVISPIEGARELKGALLELVERGLLFFERERGCYDLHPIVRQYAYDRLLQREEIHARLAQHFQSMSNGHTSEELTGPLRKIRLLYNASLPGSGFTVESVDDLVLDIEIYHHMFHAKQFVRAFDFYYQYLAHPLYHRLGAYQTVIELLQGFFSGGEREVAWSKLNSDRQSWLLDALAHAYSATGDSRRAIELLEASIRLDRERRDKESLATALWNLAVQQQVLGKLFASEQSLEESLAICREINDTYNEAKTHQHFSLLRAYQGAFNEASWQLDSALALSTVEIEVSVWAYRALCALLAEETPFALAAARRARELADGRGYERGIIRAEWLLGLILVRLAQKEGGRATDMLREADQHLTEALSRCRRIDMVDYEADLLLAWARFYHAKGDKHHAKEFASEALAIVNRSEYRVLRADVYNLLARLEWESGNRQGAVSYAEAALQDALCDGSPYCYLPALEEAKRLLEEVRQPS